MSDKTFKTHLEVLEHLKADLKANMDAEKDCMMENVYEWDDLQRAQCRGLYNAYEQVYDYVNDLFDHCR